MAAARRLRLLSAQLRPVGAASATGRGDGALHEARTDYARRDLFPSAERVPQYHHAPLFAVGEAAAAAEFLDEHGYVVFSDVLSPQEVAAGVDGVWEWLVSAPIQL